MKNRFFAERIYLSLTLATMAMATGPRPARTNTDSVAVKLLMIASESETEASEKAIRAVRAQLSDLSIDFQIAWIQSLGDDIRVQAETSERLAKAHDATIVIWSDLMVGDSLFLYVSEPGGGRILVRSVPFNGKDQGDRFVVMAVIIRTVIEAIIDGGHIGISPPPSDSAKTPPKTSTYRTEELPASGPRTNGAEAPTDKPGPGESTDTDTDSSARLDLSAAYGLTLYSSARWTIHDVRLALAVRMNRWWRIYLAYRVQIPFGVDNSIISMTLRPHPFEIGIFARFARGPFYLDLGAGLIDDPLTWKVTHVEESHIAPTTNKFRWLVGASPFVQVSWSPLSLFKLYLAAAADIYFNESRSVVKRTNGEKTTVVDPFHARPHFQAGVTFFLF